MMKPKVSPTNFKLGRRLEHALSTAKASYKGLVKLGYCTWAGEYRVGRTVTATQLVTNLIMTLKFANFRINVLFAL